MKYRTMRFIGGEENVSLLGLGCMRFPLNEDGTIDEAQAEAMIGRALNAGINYIDTAYPYHKGSYPGSRPNTLTITCFMP